MLRANTADARSLSILGAMGVRRLPVALAAAPAREQVELSDVRLIEAMKERLAREPWVSGGIVFQAKDAILSLSGLVETEAEKAAFETMARSIGGDSSAPC